MHKLLHCPPRSLLGPIGVPGHFSFRCPEWFKMGSRTRQIGPKPTRSWSSEFGPCRSGSGEVRANFGRGRVLADFAPKLAPVEHVPILGRSGRTRAPSKSVQVGRFWANFGRGWWSLSQIRPGAGRVRPNSVEFAPALVQCGRSRPNSGQLGARIRRNSAGVGPNWGGIPPRSASSTELGPNLGNIHLQPRNVREFRSGAMSRPTSRTVRRTRKPHSVAALATWLEYVRGGSSRAGRWVAQAGHSVGCRLWGLSSMARPKFHGPDVRLKSGAQGPDLVIPSPSLAAEAMLEVPARCTHPREHRVGSSRIAFAAQAGTRHAPGRKGGVRVAARSTESSPEHGVGTLKGHTLASNAGLASSQARSRLTEIRAGQPTHPAQSYSPAPRWLRWGHLGPDPQTHSSSCANGAHALRAGGSRARASPCPGPQGGTWSRGGRRR